jgi:hypothetical protein
MTGIVDRRQLLLGAGALGVGAVAAALGPSNALADEGGPTGLLGSWDAPLTFTTGLFAGLRVDGTITLAAGGGLATNNGSSPTTGLGNWVKDDGHRFRFAFQQFVGFIPLPGVPVPPGSKLQVRGEGSVEGNAISGDFSFATFRPDGTEISQLTGSGMFAGTRIRI